MRTRDARDDARTRESGQALALFALATTVLFAAAGLVVGKVGTATSSLCRISLSTASACPDDHAMPWQMGHPEQAHCNDRCLL